METLVWLLDIETKLIVSFGWPLSCVELLGILSGLLSVWYAAKKNILTWITGLINEAFFFLVFYQVQLYSDMLLQIFFALATVYGWYYWKRSQFDNLRPVVLSFRGRFIIPVLIVLGTCFLGIEMASIHEQLPGLFKTPAAHPFVDAFTAVASMVATVLLARGAVESWIVWIAVDVVSIALYWYRGIPFMGLLYVLFLVLAIVGLLTWYQEFRSA